MYNHLEQPDDWITGENATVLDLPERELILHGIQYFQIPLKEVVYPAKSYAVAIIYAKMLNAYFNVPFYKSLKDPDLLAGNDQYYVPYHRAKNVYDQIIAYVTSCGFQANLPQVAKTIEYFKHEFYLYPNPYFDNNNIPWKV